MKNRTTNRILIIPYHHLEVNYPSFLLRESHWMSSNYIIVVSKLMKHMDLQFNSIRKENDDKFSILSKKIERRWQPDVVRNQYFSRKLLLLKISLISDWSYILSRRKNNNDDNWCCTSLSFSFICDSFAHVVLAIQWWKLIETTNEKCWWLWASFVACSLFKWRVSIFDTSTGWFTIHPKAAWCWSIRNFSQ